MLLKFIFHKWKSRVRSENITEKRKSAIIVDMEKIFNRKLSYKYFQTKSPKRSRNREGKWFYQVEISLTFTQLTFFRSGRGNLYPKKKGIRSCSYRVSNVSSLSKQWISEKETGKFQASNRRLPLSIISARRNWIRKVFFPKKRKKYRGETWEKAPPTFDAFGNDQREGGEKKVREITMKWTRN